MGLSGGVPSVMNIVCNGVEGDGRVLKTANAAKNLGLQGFVVGLNRKLGMHVRTIEGTEVILVRGPTGGATELPHQHLVKRQLPSSRYDETIEAISVSAVEVASEFKPTIVHSHDMLGIAVGFNVVNSMRSSGLQVGWVHDIHEYVRGLNFSYADALFLSELESALIDKPDELTTVSPGLSRAITMHYGLKKPTVIYSAPKVSQEATQISSSLREDLALDEGVPLAAYIGVAKEARGLRTIVRAVASMRSLHLCLVSHPNRFTDELTVMAHRLGMGERFHIRDYVENSQVVPYLRGVNAGIHALHHYPNAEIAMPNKLFEYLQARVPIVVSDVSSMSAFVSSHGIGEVFVAKDPRSLALNLRKVLGNQEKYLSAIDTMDREPFTWDVQQQKIEDLYLHLL